MHDIILLLWSCVYYIYKKPRSIVERGGRKYDRRAYCCGEPYCNVNVDITVKSEKLSLLLLIAKFVDIAMSLYSLY